MDKKASPTHMLPTTDPPQDKRHTQTESEGLETNFPSKRTGKKKEKGSKNFFPSKQRGRKSRVSNTHIRQNRLQGKNLKTLKNMDTE